MQYIETEIIDNIGVIYLNHPEKLNRFNEAMGKDYSTALESMANNNSVAVIIVTGRGKAFCAGADLSEGAKSFDNLENFSSSPVTPAYNIHKPVIAAMQGHALGLGFGIALQCDIRLVSETGKYGMIQASLGLIGDCNSHWILPRLIGFEKASHFLLQAKKHSGQDIVALGLAYACHHETQVLAEAIDMAKIIARNAPASLGASKQLLWQQQSLSLPQAQMLESQVLLQRLSQQDAKQAAQAFITKQPLHWQDLPKAIKLSDNS